MATSKYSARDAILAILEIFPISDIFQNFVKITKFSLKMASNILPDLGEDDSNLQIYQTQTNHVSYYTM